MSAMANTTPIVTTVTKTATKEKTPNGAETASRINILDLCEEHYEDILSVMDKIRRDKRREVPTRLDFREDSRKSRRMREDFQNSSAKTLSARYHNPSVRPQMRDRLRNNDGNVFGRLGHRRKSAFKRLSDTYSPSTTKSGPEREYSKDDSYNRGRPHKQNSPPSEDRPRTKDRSHDIKESYGTVMVWFNELPPESIDGYKDLKVAFLAYLMQQKKYVKDPVEIYNIKQKDGETIEDFMERFKIETGRMKGAFECMQISRFMHGINNPELTKRLNEHIPKTLEEMMTAIVAFIRGETAAASKKKAHTPWKSHDRSKW
nr:reverse transcriptase domain-containing protein [Tanacetum cinerariifolium]